MGALVVGLELAKTMVGIWVSSDFQGGNSARKVNKILAIEERYRKQRIGYE
jgi:ribose 5-phosphate isomerase B